MKITLGLGILLFAAFAISAKAEEEWDPFAPNAEQLLQSFDRVYEEATGLSAFPTGTLDEITSTLGCKREECEIFVDVNKSTQSMDLYVNGRQEARWLVSTGIPGRGTRDFNRHPDGRIYQRYMSKTYPGGDYKGLGNMPYAVFIEGGFAIHGTPESNWPKLGQKASHGCIRLHPFNAAYFNQLVRQATVANTWIWVHN